MVQIYKVFHQKSQKARKVYLRFFYTLEDATQYIEYLKGRSDGVYSIEQDIKSNAGEDSEDGNR